ncbi:MAG: (4Fe-4S)-binding protein [Candidatus Cloacimonadota bacterium]|nr:MAG: (4Fe-4S)-binding protein [Candidatus Cloacimonadota bacterium]
MAHETVFLSGKGGTGKTSLTSCFAFLAKEQAVMVDCDVDAADLHLMLNPSLKNKTEYYSGSMPEINNDLCIKCGLCVERCPFDALKLGDKVTAELLECEGCGYCKLVCPQNAVVMRKRLTGYIFESSTNYGQHFIHAKMTAGAENSGKTVTELKKRARTFSEKNQNKFILIDGSPGIGCPVISSISDTDSIVIIIEATQTGYRDYLRVSDLVKRFSKNVSVIINKFDLNPETTEKIMKDIAERDDKVIGKLNYSAKFTEAVKQGIPYAELYDDEITEEIKSIWNKIKEDVI